MKDGYVTVNEIKLHYVEEGQGSLVILLHGFPDFWYGWRKQIPFLSQYYRIVVPDMRGYNLSEKPKRVEDYRLSILASDIAKLIENLGAKQAMVIGHDWGGAVAWALATYYPQLVAKLAVLNAPHPSEMIRALRTLNLTQWRKSYYALLFQLPYIPEWFIGKNLAKFFWGLFKKVDSYDTGINVVLTKYVRAFSNPSALTGPINYYRAAMRYMSDLDIRTTQLLAMPVLMIWGEQDKALGKELTYYTSNYCSDLEVIYDPKSGHWIQIDNPELVNSKLLEFLRR